MLLAAAKMASADLPVMMGKPIRQADFPSGYCPQPRLNGTAITAYQNDIKNYWPDGSIKFEVATFIDPSASAGTVDNIAWGAVASANCNSAGSSETIANMLSLYNFDAQIQLANTGGTTPSPISANAMLSFANTHGGCITPTNGDIDTALSTAGVYCAYWMKGPLVTAIVLEDRIGRTYDVKTDSSSGNPLHPRFTVYFFPFNHTYLVEYTLEDDWASSTAANSARNQTFTSFTLTIGSSSPQTVFTNYGTGWTLRTRAMYHQTFCSTSTTATPVPNTCSGAVHVDHNWAYLSQTKFLPHWDTLLTINPTKIASEASILTNNTALNWNACPSCVQGSSGIAYYQGALGAPGAAEWHGPLPTWDIIYLMTQCDAGNSTSASCGNGSSGDMYSTMLANADRAGIIPYWFREADSSAGIGTFFDANASFSGSVPTKGRVISINARTQVSLNDTTSQLTGGSCGGTIYTQNFINYGGSGQDYSYWSAPDLDPSHEPNTALASYLSTGYYGYYEQQMMQSAYNEAMRPGNTACADTPTRASSSQAAKGYWDVVGERDEDWMWREVMLGAFIGIDGTPEQVYFLDKFKTNLATLEGSQNVTCDVTGSGVQESYCGASNTTNAWGFGNSVRTGVPYVASTLGSWTTGMCVGCYLQSPLNTSGPNAPAAANANFQNSYSVLMVGWTNQLGYCPGSCSFLSTVANRQINITLNPAANIFNFEDYVYPVLNNAGAQISSWTQNQTLYATQPSSFTCYGNSSADEGYAYENMTGLSFDYNLVSSQGGYSGAMAWYKLLSALVTGGPGCITDFQNYSPKWDITPLPLNGATPAAPQALIPTFNPPAGTYSGPQTVLISTASGTILCWNITGSPQTNGAGTGCTVGTLINSSSGTVPVSSSETLYAVAGAVGYTDSTVGSAAYVISTAITPSILQGTGKISGTGVILP